jgi:hypothetical protein
MWQTHQQKKALRAAFAAEIDGLLKIGRLGRHDNSMREWIKKWQAGENAGCGRASTAPFAEITTSATGGG